jgi:nucleotide-binding universal stress UspA family protein
MRSKTWTGFRSVLCPIDFSDNSRTALRYAEAIALRGSATLRVVYANDPLLLAAAAAALHDRRLVQRSAKELQAFTESTLPVHSQKQLHVTSHVSTGDPADEIIKAAARHRSDLVVIGTHGLTGVGRLLMGSTTLGVLQRTKVPILAVPRAPERATASTPSSSWPGEEIVAALELDHSAGRDVESAARLARWFGTSLLLLHVVNEIARPDWVRGDLSAHDQTRVAHAQRRLDRLAARASSHVKISSRVTCGSIASEITALALAERTGLVITALHDRRGWFGARRGSISYHVLTRAATPVFAYPPHWRLR